MRNPYLAVAMLMTAATGSVPAQANGGYTFTTIDVPGAYSTYPQAINGVGQVAGYYTTSLVYYTGYLAERGWHGFVLNHGVYTTIDVPGALWTGALAINDSGQVFGTYYASELGPEGLFEYDLNTETLKTMPLNIDQSSSFVDVTAISPTGVVVGSINYDSFEYANGALITTNLPVRPVCINAAGAIVGGGATSNLTSSAVYLDGVTRPLPKGLGASAIGPSNQIVEIILCRTLVTASCTTGIRSRCLTSPPPHSSTIRPIPMRMFYIHRRRRTHTRSTPRARLSEIMRMLTTGCTAFWPVLPLRAR
ncbi:MAG: hypothetical protein JO061_18585 [Acidobacteriaceae bacterium]|nr:hypothetical protein [Acidobacteriaceae bacterium]